LKGRKGLLSAQIIFSFPFPFPFSIFPLPILKNKIFFKKNRRKNAGDNVVYAAKNAISMNQEKDRNG